MKKELVTRSAHTLYCIRTYANVMYGAVLNVTNMLGNAMVLCSTVIYVWFYGAIMYCIVMYDTFM